jgi:biofilm PGA synthesis N-glycosyltransferase PgaC
VFSKTGQADGWAGTIIMKTCRYVVIIPVRDEDAFIGRALESLATQDIPPVECVVVNDGSTDDTGAIAERFAARHAWLHVVHRKDRGHRASGVGVMEAFAAGLATLRTAEWDFLVKLDADLSFGPSYFRLCFERFDMDSRLGIGGGSICVDRNGASVVEYTGDPAFHVRGATKIYRRACWDEIGGLVRSTGWDTIDEIMANQLGWKTGTFADITLLQHRVTGGAGSLWRDYVKNGRANYLTGYHPLFMLIKCARRLFMGGYVKNAAGLWWGFLVAWVRRMPRPVDRSVVDYIRREQMNFLLGRPSLWSRQR